MTAKAPSMPKFWILSLQSVADQGEGVLKASPSICCRRAGSTGSGASPCLSELWTYLEGVGR